MFIGSTSHAGGTKNYGFYYHYVILETRVYILL